MKKEEFLSLSLDEQVAFINEQLSQGISFNQVVRDLNVPKTTLFNRINKFFRKEGNSYVPIEMLNNPKTVTPAYDNGFSVAGDRLTMMAAQAGAIQEILSSVKKMESEMSGIWQNHPGPETSAVKVDNRPEPVAGQLLKVQLPAASANYVSFQVNKEVLKCWNAFVRNMHGFSSGDLISMALKEFMDKYE